MKKSFRYRHFPLQTFPRIKSRGQRKTKWMVMCGVT